MLHTLRTRRSASSTAMRKTKVLMTSARRCNHFHVPSVLIIFTAHRPDGTDTECASDVPHPAPCSYLLFQPRPFVREGSGRHVFTWQLEIPPNSVRLFLEFSSRLLSLLYGRVFPCGEMLNRARCRSMTHRDRKYRTTRSFPAQWGCKALRFPFHFFFASFRSEAAHGLIDRPFCFWTAVCVCVYGGIFCCGKMSTRTVGLCPLVEQLGGFALLPAKKVQR